MSDWLTMTRRRCLALIFGSLVAVSEAWPSGRRSARDPRSVEAQAARWRTQLRSPRSAAIVGSAHLEVVSQTEAELVDALAAAIDRPDAGVLDLSDGEIGRRLRATIRSDYHRNRTVRLRGWTVSLTEAQLCAMYALDEKTA
jgi:hypothetical protein